MLFFLFINVNSSILAQSLLSLGNMAKNNIWPSALLNLIYTMVITLHIIAPVQLIKHIVSI